MDVKKIGGVWTEEQHSAYLNRIEETFVRRMPRPRMDDVGDGESGLRLDRVLPDSATESNRDHLEKKRRTSSSSR